MRFFASLILCISVVCKFSIANDELSSNEFFSGDFLPNDLSSPDSIEAIPSPASLANQDQDSDGSNVLSDISGVSDGCFPNLSRRSGKIRARQDSFCHTGSTRKDPGLEETGTGDPKKPLPSVPSTAAPVGDRDSIDLEKLPVKNLRLKEICPESFGPYNRPACSSIQPRDTVCAPSGICVLNNCEQCMFTRHLRNASEFLFH